MRAGAACGWCVFLCSWDLKRAADSKTAHHPGTSPPLAELCISRPMARPHASGLTWAQAGEYWKEAREVGPDAAACWCPGCSHSQCRSWCRWPSSRLIVMSLQRGRGCSHSSARGRPGMPMRSAWLCGSEIMGISVPVHLYHALRMAMVQILPVCELRTTRSLSGCSHNMHIESCASHAECGTSGRQ